MTAPNTELSLGILEAGRLPDGMEEIFGAYPKMFTSLLSAADPDIDFKSYPVLDDAFPDSHDECDAWLVTGSRFGVYENTPWMQRLSEFIRQAYALEQPIVGICFGHQILAHALGGKVVKSDKGWGVGVHDYEFTQRPDWLGEDDSEFSIHAFHQDQVVELPEQARVIASSGFCPYAGLAYENKAISFQGHPEFKADYMQALCESRRGTVVPVETADTALESLSRPVDREKSARWITRFIRQAVKKS